MRCLSCNSRVFHIVESDPQLMACSDCHEIHSVSYAKGYWTGYIAGHKRNMYCGAEGHCSEKLKNACYIKVCERI